MNFLTPRGFVLFCLLVVSFWGCDTIENVDSLDQRPAWDRELVSSRNDPQLQLLVDKYFPGSNAGRVENEFGVLNTEEVSKISNDTSSKYAALFDTDDPYVFTNLIMSASADTSYAYIIQYLPDHTWYDSIGYDHSNWHYFTGEIYYYDLEGNAFGYSCMRDGTTDEACTSDMTNGRTEDVIVSCNTTVWITIGCAGGTCEVTNVEFESSCTISITDSSTGSHNSDPYEHPDARRCSYDRNYDCNPPTDPTPTRIPACGRGTVYDPKAKRCVNLADFWEQDKVCTTSEFNNNPCISGVWNKLKRQNSAHKLLSKFNSENPTAEVCLDAKPVPNNSDGNTRGGMTWGNKDPIEIEINSDLVGFFTEIEFALSIFHELVHAEMWRKIKSVNNSLSPNNFPGLFEYYSRHFKVLKDDGTWHYPNGTPQHNFMADHYITMMTDALMEFDGVNLSDSQLRINYEALAWQGLQETSAWKNKPNYEKRAIINGRQLLINGRAKCN